MPWIDSDTSGGKVCQKYSMLNGETIPASGLAPGEMALQAADGRLVYRDATGNLAGFPGADGINKIVALTQAEYDALTPDANTLYVIT